jgi:hypothetical protein
VKFKPNTTLPAGGRLFKKTIKRVIATWVEQEFDAEVYRFGIRWLRVKEGMGGKGNREDWVADLPVNASVHDYNWRSAWPGWLNHGSIDKAIVAEMKEVKAQTLEDEESTVKKLARLRLAARTLSKSLSKAKRTKLK